MRSKPMWAKSQPKTKEFMYEIWEVRGTDRRKIDWRWGLEQATKDAEKLRAKAPKGTKIIVRKNPKEWR